MEQYFLSNPQKIAMIISAAEVTLSSRVIELGAGIGSVAHYLPKCQNITLVEKDAQLARGLRNRFPSYRIVQADAIQALPLLCFDVLLSHLPFSLTDNLLKTLSLCSFKVATLAIHQKQTCTRYFNLWDIHLVTFLDKKDFSPPQPFSSQVIKVIPKRVNIEDNL